MIEQETTDEWMNRVNNSVKRLRDDPDCHNRLTELKSNMLYSDLDQSKFVFDSHQKLREMRRVRPRTPLNFKGEHSVHSAVHTTNHNILKMQPHQGTYRALKPNETDAAKRRNNLTGVDGEVVLFTPAKIEKNQALTYLLDPNFLLNDKSNRKHLNARRQIKLANHKDTSYNAYIKQPKTLTTNQTISRIETGGAQLRKRLENKLWKGFSNNTSAMSPTKITTSDPSNCIEDQGEDSGFRISKIKPISLASLLDMHKQRSSQSNSYIRTPSPIMNTQQSQTNNPESSERDYAKYQPLITGKYYMPGKFSRRTGASKVTLNNYPKPMYKDSPPSMSKKVHSASQSISVAHTDGCPSTLRFLNEHSYRSPSTVRLEGLVLTSKSTNPGE